VRQERQFFQLETKDDHCPPPHSRHFNASPLDLSSGRGVVDGTVSKYLDDRKAIL